MADEPQDTTADPEEAGGAAAEEAAVEEPSPSGEAEDDTSAEGGEGTGPDVEQDEEGVAEVTEHSRINAHHARLRLAFLGSFG